MKKATLLKHAIIDHPGSQYRIAVKMEISESRLSRLASGRSTPTEKERKLLSEILKIEEYKLFPGLVSL